MKLLDHVTQAALDHGVPWSAHIDVTYRCNERCAHCYLNHDNRGEMSTAEIGSLLDQLAEAGTFFLTLSGGEPFVRRDLFEILAKARALDFSIKLKTNGTMLKPEHVTQLRELGVETVQISVYSHRSEVHDGITKLPGSLSRTIRAIEALRGEGIKVTIANVLMRENIENYAGVQQLAARLGANFTLDPMITPHLEGDSSVLAHRIPMSDLRKVFHEPALIDDVEDFCAPSKPANDDVLESFPCSAGHTLVYISPYAEVFPCVQFPLALGSLRKQTFREIWNHSGQLAEVRSIRVKNLSTCPSCSHVGGCTRCAGLAYMEGNMRGPSSADCDKSFARTGIESEAMKRGFSPRSGLVQIQLNSVAWN